MNLRLSRREWLAASICLPSVVAGSSDWHGPVPFGRSGLKVTRLAFGIEDVKDPRLIRVAADLGITYFNYFTPPDSTAGFAIAAEGIKPVRKQVVFSIGTPRKDAKGVLTHLDDQLRLLAMESVDVLYLTGRSTVEHINDELLDAVETARKAGKIRAGAISTHLPQALLARLLSQNVIQGVMPVCNPAVWPIRAPQLKALREKEIATIAMKPMMAAFTWLPPDKKEWGAQFDTPEKKTVALAAALKWAIANPYITTIPVRMTSEDELRRNLKSAAEPFNERDAEILAIQLERFGSYYCRMCESCAGTCRLGLRVPDVLRYASYATGYRDPARGRAEFSRMPAEQQAIRCSECPGCTVQCRFGINVQEQAMSAQNLLHG